MDLRGEAVAGGGRQEEEGVMSLFPGRHSNAYLMVFSKAPNPPSNLFLVFLVAEEVEEAGGEAVKKLLGAQGCPPSRTSRTTMRG